MAAVGLQIGLKDIRDAGWKPLMAGTLQWAFLSLGSLLLARWLCA